MLFSHPLGILNAPCCLASEQVQFLLVQGRGYDFNSDVYEEMKVSAFYLWQRENITSHLREELGLQASPRSLITAASKPRFTERGFIDHDMV